MTVPRASLYVDEGTLQAIRIQPKIILYIKVVFFFFRFADVDTEHCIAVLIFILLTVDDVTKF